MSKSETTFVVATLWECIQPIDRGDRYEDPLDGALGSEELGQVCGGGSQLSNDCGIEFVDIDIELNDRHRGIEVIRATLESQGAPKGSTLRFADDDVETTIVFGITECLAIFLDGIGLPREVYENTDINVLAGDINAVLSEKSLGEIRSSWCGPRETAIFIYGTNADEIYLGLRSILETYPLCCNARVVIRHGKAELQPRTIRIPM